MALAKCHGRTTVIGRIRGGESDVLGEGGPARDEASSAEKNREKARCEFAVRAHACEHGGGGA